MSGFVAAQPPDFEMLNEFDRLLKQLQWSRVSRNVHVAMENGFVYSLVSLRTTDVDPGDQITLGGSRHGERLLVRALEPEQLAIYLRIWVHRRPQQDLAKYIPPVNLSFAVKQELLLLRSNAEEIPSTITQLSKDITILSQANCVFAGLVGIQIVYLLEKSPIRATRQDPSLAHKRLQGSSQRTEADNELRTGSQQRSAVPNLPPVTVFQPNFEPTPLAALDFRWTLDVYPKDSTAEKEALVNQTLSVNETHSYNNFLSSSTSSSERFLDVNGHKAIESLVKYNEELKKSRRANEKKIPSVLCSMQKLVPSKDEASSESF
ncbi:hypothetical protein Gasu2_66440 [Galdieria sulphuraria]|uniref:Uncharacterized protein n=1 Tax=Galdieria sulphuraria TaxID=130081 RepID=M2XTB0_GALSU|nr:uncharacterized protein Gasu_55580 [Galdieria sulphuraria]EME26873.1 hypothetical protein Gasu_55580 [Galdieria sulphuraria]GJD12569.1 hypothetical protein Gasu2_66440 [Galdieria sulphuraria]|eukprot:XP_005703393.1 hypothetical protein Gasu_55580 [Galdieria sulphuraria]